MLKPVLSLSLLLLALPLHQQPAPDATTPATATAAAPLAPIPAGDAAKVNPVKATPVSLAKARKMYGYDAPCVTAPPATAKATSAPA